MSGCADPNFCRGGCCRSFAGTQFCDVESNCTAAPTWIIALVPTMLGVAALILVILVIIRLRNRKVIEIYDRIGNAESDVIKNQQIQGQQSDRNVGSDRPFRTTKH